jgi:hypothetical protein
VRYWNEIAINGSGLDHTPVAAGENRVFGEQLGPGRSSRAMAIVHIAIFEVVNAITGGYRSYIGLAPAERDTSIDAAIAQAASDTLITLFPSQSASFNELLAADLGQIPDGRAKADESISDARRRPRSSRLEPTMARSVPSRVSASISSPVMSRGSGAKTRSV